MIQLIGPGGAGKSTVGALLAQRLGASFIDLDEAFIANAGNISRFIEVYGYDAYAEQNVRTYLRVAVPAGRQAVLALSSGFMTYPPHIHPDYSGCHQKILASPLTFVLLPSLDCEACVAEIVRRQLLRPFARSVEREEQVIRARFSVYAEFPARKVETMRPAMAVVDEIESFMAAQQAAAADERRAGIEVA